MKPDPSDPSLFFLLREVSIIAQLSTAMLEAHTPDGVLSSHFGVLNHLLRVRDGSTPLELARAFQVPKTTMTHTLQGLTKRGWVETRPNPADARSKLIHLTDDGRVFVEQMVARLSKEYADVNAALPGVAGELLPGIQTLRAYLDQRRNGEPDR